MADVPWWGVMSSAAAPVLLVGGWTVAARLQPRHFNPVADTVSGLMAVGATDRWVMGAAIVAVGICYVITGAALRPAARAGRLILVVGAVAGMLVVTSPETPGGGPASHVIWASLGFAGLAAWPAGAWRRDSPVPWSLRPQACLAIVAVQVALLAWFLTELVLGAGQAGLAERVAAVCQALCPFAMVLSCRRVKVRPSRSETPRHPVRTP